MSLFNNNTEATSQYDPVPAQTTATQVMTGTPPTSSTALPSDPSKYQDWWNSYLTSKGSPASSYDLIKQWAPELQQQGIKVNYNLSGDPSKLIFPDGNYYSVVDQNGQWRWVNTSANAGASGGSGGGTPFNPSSINLNPTQAAPSSAQEQSVWSTLMARAGQPETVDTNSPTFRQQADTYAAGVERSRRTANADNAEVMNAQNLGGSGAQGVVDRANNEKASQMSGSFEAQLAGRELQNRRDEIQKALDSATQLGNADAQRQLQEQLGQIDAQLRAAGITSNELIAGNQTGYNYAALQSQQNAEALRLLLARTPPAA